MDSKKDQPIVDDAQSNEALQTQLNELKVDQLEEEEAFRKEEEAFRKEQEAFRKGEEAFRKKKEAKRLQIESIEQIIANRQSSVLSQPQHEQQILREETLNHTVGIEEESKQQAEEKRKSKSCTQFNKDEEYQITNQSTIQPIQNVIEFTNNSANETVRVIPQNHQPEDLNLDLSNIPQNANNNTTTSYGSGVLNFIQQQNTSPQSQLLQNILEPEQPDGSQCQDGWLCEYHQNQPLDTQEQTFFGQIQQPLVQGQQNQSQEGDEIDNESSIESLTKKLKTD